ncbi:Cell wall-associated hydrolase, NlpC family [Actinacidiphila yanglinensis]|uniref:Cell wall-associated hydrolase, NlpC family n=1 Tax=Actinacidiphila yanglinensis TaxID=310779 RepID=A0A1H6BPW1_9ACTN|nr:NlpC/P60 family protein [Actinacidiphila yanglinensis]SEG62714.1 Cell wall-associated hydrolase, NlpC family [Actinacidiphila yanglinensis]
MASHRKPRTRILAMTAPRAAVGITTAALASVTLMSETANAAPAKPSISEVKKQVDSLNQQAEVATQQYDQAKEKTATQRTKTNQLLADVADKTEKMNESRRVLGQFAAEQYRTGGFGATTQLLFSNDPQSFLSQNHLLDRMTATQEQALKSFKIQQEQASVQRAQATASLQQLTSSQSKLATQKKNAQTKLAAAQKLLNSLNAEQKKKLAALQPKAPASSATYKYSGPASGRVATAIQFALAQRGKPYVSGATGPNSYDCSGLTQAAYRAAGITIGRTTWDQVKDGTAVSESDLQPGDLVFFYSGISHVGIYIGNGNVVHAPHTGASVEIAPMDWMPFAAARRIA